MLSFEGLVRTSLYKTLKGPEGSFLMAVEITSAEFWTNPYTKKLPPSGKLALHFVLGCEFAGGELIMEDMSMLTGLELSECKNWADQFEEDDIHLMEPRQ